MVILPDFPLVFCRIIPGILVIFSPGLDINPPARYNDYKK